MADITKLSRLAGGVQRHVTLNTNTLVVDNLKILMGSGNDANHATFSGSLTAARTISMPDANVALADIATNKTHVDGDGSDHQDVADLVTLSGVAANSTDLGTFSGSTIPDSQTDKQALQALESAHEEVDQNVDDLVSLSGVSENATNLGTFSGSTIADDQTNKQALQALETAHEETDQNVDDLISLSGVAENATNLGTFSGTTIADDQDVKAALQALETKTENNAALQLNQEFQNSAIDFVTDNTVVPVSENSGDRFVLDHAGGSPNAAWDGASAGDIVEFDGSSWIAVTPTVGMIIAIDDETTSLRQFGGATWDEKFFESTTASTGLTKNGFDIQLADVAENASGIKVLSGSITLEDLGAFSTSDLSEGSNEYFTETRVRASLLTGLDVGTNDSVEATDSVLAAFGFLQANQADLTSLSGVSQGDVNLGSFTGSIISDDRTIKQALQDLESSASDTESLSEPMTAGEEFLNTTTGWAVRMGISTLDSPETANRIYKADPTEESLVKAAGNVDAFNVIGLMDNSATVAVAGEETVIKQGLMTITGHGMTKFGEPFYLATGGVLSQDIDDTASEANVKCGIVRDANTVEVAIQIMGVN